MKAGGEAGSLTDSRLTSFLADKWGDVGKLVAVFALMLGGFITAAAIFMPQQAYMVTAEHFKIADGPWQNAFKTDYIRNNALMLYRGNSGSLEVPLNSDFVPTAVEVSYYAFESGTVELTLQSGGKEIGHASITTSSSGKQAIGRFTLDGQILAEDKALILSVSDTTFRYFSVDHVAFQGSQSPIRIGFLLQSASACLLLCAALAVAQRFTIRTSVSTRHSWVFIDQLRGVAVLLVLALHTLGGSGLPGFDSWPYLRKFIYNGHYGVELFYVVSAFTLTLSLLHARAAETYSYRPFLHNRFTRIVPSFAAVFLLAMLFRPMIVDAAKPLTTAMVVDNLMLAHIFDPASRLLPLNHSVWWSIATEFQFYIFLPLLVMSLAFLARRISPAFLWLSFLAAATGLSIYVETGWPKVLSWSRLSAFYHFDAFAAGIAAAFSFHAWRVAGKVPSAKYARWFWLAGAGLLVIALSGFPGGIQDIWSNDFVTQNRLERLQVLAAIVLLICYIYFAKEGESTPSLLGTVGTLSFIIYLVHVPALRIARDLLAPYYMGVEELYYLYLLAVGLALSIVIALLLHRVVEVPAARLMKGRRSGPLLAVSTGYAVAFVSLSLYRSLF